MFFPFVALCNVMKLKDTCFLYVEMDQVSAVVITRNIHDTVRVHSHSY